MTTIEHAPQRPKTFDGRKQDHGDAATQTLDRLTDPWDRRGATIKEKVHLELSLQDVADAYGLSSDELEAAADELLYGPIETPYTTETSLAPQVEVKVEIDADFDDEDLIDRNGDGFLTEADFGVRSRQQVRRLIAQRATLDHEFGYDDNGDDDFDSHIRIRKL